MSGKLKNEREMRKRDIYLFAKKMEKKANLIMLSAG